MDSQHVGLLLPPHCVIVCRLHHHHQLDHEEMCQRCTELLDEKKLDVENTEDDGRLAAMSKGMAAAKEIFTNVSSTWAMDSWVIDQSQDFKGLVFKVDAAAFCASSAKLLTEAGVLIACNKLPSDEQISGLDDMLTHSSIGVHFVDEKSRMALLNFVTFCCTYHIEKQGKDWAGMASRAERMCRFLDPQGANMLGPMFLGSLFLQTSLRSCQDAKESVTDIDKLKLISTTWTEKVGALVRAEEDASKLLEKWLPLVTATVNEDPWEQTSHSHKQACVVVVLVGFGGL